MRPKDSPLISVIMGVFHKSRDVSKLEVSIRSILAQTYTNLEFLICENGSSDEALSLLNLLTNEDNRVVLIDGTNAESLTQKLNLCIKKAQGSIIARMDEDDYSYPNRFERQIEYLKEHPDCAVVGCCVKEVDGAKEYFRNLPQEPSVADFRITCPFVHPTLMMRKEALVFVGGYSEDARQVGCDDYDMLLKLYAKGYRGANLPEIMLDYSIKSSQLKKKPYRLFVNEFVTRMQRFYDLGLLPQWMPWALKPLFAGLIPRHTLYTIKHIWKDLTYEQ